MSLMPQIIRPPSVAGTFYPEDPVVMADQVSDLLASERGHDAAPRAVIAPHAGWQFSGALAARALGATRRRTVQTLVVMSPAHRHVFDGIALPSQAILRTPGQDMVIDIPVCDALLEDGLARICDAAHDGEHGIEVLLPFLAHLHPDARILPLVVGRSSTVRIAELVDRITKLADPLFVLSSDLSHYLPANDARVLDRETARLIEVGPGSSLENRHACGARVIAGFLQSQLAKGLRPLRLGMANSASVSGDKTRTVGYGAWAFFDGQSEIMDAPLRKVLLHTARRALSSRLVRGRPPEISIDSFPEMLRTHGASFVSLSIAGRLRGCIGSLGAHQPLVRDVALNAIKAGTADRRFQPMTLAGLEKTDIKIALLSPSNPVTFASQQDLEDQLQPGRDGLILSDGSARGTFLPMVWDQLQTPRAFVEGLKVKAGLAKSHWSKTLKIRRFYAESFSDTDRQSG